MQEFPGGSDVLASLFKRGHPDGFGQFPDGRLFAPFGGQAANCLRIVYSEFQPL